MVAVEQSGDPVEGAMDAFWGVLERSGVNDRARRRAERLSSENNTLLPVVIAELGLASDADVVAAYGEALGLPGLAVDLPDEPLFPDILNADYLRAHRILQMAADDQSLILAMVDPLNQDAINAISFATGLSVQPEVIALTDWRKGFETLYGVTDEEASEPDAYLSAGWTDDSQRLKDLSNEAPIVRRVERLFTDAVDAGATDIHVEPAPGVTRIRFRVDGQLESNADEAAEIAALIVSRVKVLCDMDVADRRRPQDGRTSIAVRGRPIDLRVSTVPTAYGESLAIRILDRAASLLDLSKLGFSKHDEAMIEQVLKTPKGIFLVTGPTGSGKTTTLYAALNQLRKTQRKILTVEDPIEYFFEDINQVQVNEAAEVTFANTLRSFLRQDPDILMVGEIRDAETAKIAVQAALTGHLVLSTLHTNDAISAVARLKDMGVEEYLIAATLSGVTAQRLVRNSSGKGRTVISEGFLATPEIKAAIRDGKSETEILRLARQSGMESLLDDGKAKAKAGLVHLDDVYAAVGSG